MGRTLKKGPLVMEGHIDTTFTTSYRDMLAAGTIAEIGVNAFAVWHAIKNHADFATGQAWPGMRALATMTGLSRSSVQRAVQVLIEQHLLRVTLSASKTRGQTYVACERLRITIGNTLICTVIVDYLPANLRQTISRVHQALTTGENDPQAFANVTVIPCPGLQWDTTSCTLRGAFPAHSLVPRQPAPDDPAMIAGQAFLARLTAPKI